MVWVRLVASSAEHVYLLGVKRLGISGDAGRWKTDGRSVASATVLDVLQAAAAITQTT